MKIGFFGALANNTYVTAKSLYRQGVQVVYIRDIGDVFPFSQPIWEDVPFTLAYEDIYAYWNRQKWYELEQKLNWMAPPFMHNPGEIPDMITDVYSTETLLKLWYLQRPKYRKKVISAMQSLDCLIVCGIEATILAWASGKPYIIWPHGGDIRFAAGIGTEWSFNPRIFLENKLRRHFLKKAYTHCLWIASHDPTGSGGHVGQIDYLLHYFSLPLQKKQRLEKDYRHSQLVMLFKKLKISIPLTENYIFVPSRIDYYWKGTDRLLKAIESSNLQNSHFIFSGWGQDYQDARQKMKHYQNCTFLPWAISKPILYQIFASVDLVIDQFLLGCYGTSALEAMSRGTPVMMHIENKNFLDKGWLPPPVINVQSPSEIAQVLEKIDTGQFDFDSCSREISDWFDKTHNEVVAVPRILSDIQESLATL